MNFGELKRLLKEAEQAGSSDSDTVAFRAEDETGRNPSFIYIVKGVEPAPLTFTEGNADSVGGTIWLYGKEY